MKIIITADLHLHPRLTSEDILRGFIQSIPQCDLFIVAGDLGERGGWFQRSLPIIEAAEAQQIAILLGNHDLWTDDPDEVTSEQLWVSILPDAIRNFGLIYLEEEIIRLDRTAIVGTIAWYDYSIDRTILPDIARSEKGQHNNDGNFMTEWDDLDFAEKCYNHLRQKLVELDKDHRIDEVVVITHVPVFAEQHVVHDGDKKAGDAYFYNLTMGNMIATFKKVRYVVSGHTHRPVDLMIDPIRVVTVDSDYGKPGFVELDFNTYY